MNRLGKKLGDLEKNVVSDTPNYKETKLTINNIPEQRLHQKALSILEPYLKRLEKTLEVFEKDPATHWDLLDGLELNLDDQAIVNKSINLLRLRVFGLLDLALGSDIHLNDPFNKRIFYRRLNWFLREMKDWLFLRWQEDQVYDDPEYFNLCAGDQAKRFEPIHSKWRDWLSKESWEKYCLEHEKTKVADSIRELTPEEIEEDRKQFELDNAEEEAKGAKFLVEKCPSCKEKCKWYYEQIDAEKIVSKSTKEQN